MQKIVFIVFMFSSIFLKAEKDSITVYYFLAEECVICQDYTPLMNELFEAYNSSDVSFVGLFPNRFSKEESIEEFKTKYKIPFLLKREFFQTKTKKFKVEITPEVVVYNESQKEIIYKGRIDNMFVRLGKRRRVVTTSELKDVLDDIQSGITKAKDFTQSVGCFINLVEE